MADLTEVNPDLPAQATGGTLPGLAADLKDIAPAPTTSDALLEANYGTRGAQQYQDLRAAGQQTGVAPSLATLAGTAPAPAAIPQNQPSEIASGGIGRALMTLGGNPQGAAQAQQHQQQQILAATKARNEATNDLFTLIPAAFKQFAGQPDKAGAFLQGEAARRGLALPPSVSMYVNQLIEDGKLTPDDIQAKLNNPATTVAERTRLMSSIAPWNQFVKDKAESDKITFETSKQEEMYGLQKRKTEAEIAKATGAGAATPKSAYQGQRLAAVETLSSELGRPPSEAEITDKVAELAAAAKAPPMTVQRAREQVASSKSVAQDLLKALDDPKFSSAKTRLGPSMSTTIGGVSLGPAKTNLAWRNYKDFGGQGNSPEENMLMEKIGYYQGTGFQAFLAGIRNKDIVDDIRIHIPAPWDEESTIRSKVNYLNGRYDDVLKEYKAGGRPVGAKEPSVVAPPVDLKTWLDANQ